MNAKEIQQLLNRAGATPPVPITGRLDHDTTEAIRDFQIASRLPLVTGKPDAKFLAVLRKAAEKGYAGEAPGMTDLMISPEAIDETLETSLPPSAAVSKPAKPRKRGKAKEA